MARIDRSSIKALAAASLLALAGCATGITQDPCDRPGSWQATGVNDHNLRAMVATPSHHRARRGREHRARPGGSVAATRLFTDRRRRLLVLSASTVGGAQQQPQSDPPVTGTGSGGGGGGGASR
jgi:hypothetical protein